MNPSPTTFLWLGGAFVLLVAVAYGLQRRVTPRPRSVTCPACSVVQIGFREPDTLKERLQGGYACPACGAKMDRWGKPTGR